MAERELYPDGEQRRRIMDFIMAAGQTLLENGAEVFRVEQTMEIMAASFHLREFHVYVLTNGIFASAGTAEMSEVRNVPTRTTHLGRVAAVNQLSRQIASGEVDTIDEAETRLAQARCIPFPKDWVQLAAGVLLCANLWRRPESRACRRCGRCCGQRLPVVLRAARRGGRVPNHLHRRPHHPVLYSGLQPAGH